MPFEANGIGPRELRISANQLAARSGLCSFLPAGIALTAAPGRPGRREPAVRRGRDEPGDAGNKTQRGDKWPGQERAQRCPMLQRSRSWSQLSWWLHAAVSEACGCVACWQWEQSAGSGGMEHGAPHPAPALQRWSESPNPPSGCCGSGGVSSTSPVQLRLKRRDGAGGDWG